MQVAFHALSNGTLFLALQRTGTRDYIEYYTWNGSWSGATTLVAEVAGFDWCIESSCLGQSDLIHFFVGKIPSPFSLPLHLYHVAINSSGTIGTLTQIETIGYEVFGNADVGEASAGGGKVGIPAALFTSGVPSIYAIVGDDSLNPTFGSPELVWNGSNDAKFTADSWGAAPMLMHASIFLSGTFHLVFTVLSNSQNDVASTQGKIYHAERTGPGAFSTELIFESTIPNVVVSPYFALSPGTVTDMAIFFATFDISIFFNTGTKYDALHLGSAERFTVAGPPPGPGATTRVILGQWLSTGAGGNRAYLN